MAQFCLRKRVGPKVVGGVAGDPDPGRPDWMEVWPSMFTGRGLGGDPSQQLEGNGGEVSSLPRPPRPSAGDGGSWPASSSSPPVRSPSPPFSSVQPPVPNSPFDANCTHVEAPDFHQTGYDSLTSVEKRQLLLLRD